MNKPLSDYLIFVLYVLLAIVRILGEIMKVEKSITYGITDIIIGVIVLVILVYIFAT